MQLIDCARQAGVSADALRHYLRVGLVEAEGRSTSGCRMFSERSVARVRFVRGALALGFSLKDAGELVAMSRRGKSPCPRARSLLDARLEEQGHQLDAAVRLHRRMTRAVNEWKQRPDGHSVCSLNEGSASLDPHVTRQLRGAGTKS